MTPDVGQLVRGNNAFWSLMFYDVLVEADHFQVSFLAGADLRFYNAVHALSRSDPATLAAAEQTCHALGLAPAAIYVDPAAPPAIDQTLRARGYEIVEDEEEIWVGCSTDRAALTRMEASLANRPAPGAVRIERIGPEGPRFEAFLRIDAEANAIPPGLVTKLRANLESRRNPAVEPQLFLGFVGDEPCFTGAVGVVDGVAYLAEAGTAAAHRGRGLYSAMLVERLRFAAERRARAAYFTASRTAASVPAAERLGFVRAFTRTFYERAHG